MLRIEHLTKTFRSHWLYRQIEAVKDVSLEIKQGESFGFLGHNGAGKTTAIKCIVGLIHKTSGKVFLEGKELETAGQHAKLSYLPERPYFYDHLTVRETLEFLTTLYGIKGPEKQRRVDETLERVNLTARTNNSVRSLSKGLQQRLGFAQAIVNNPTMLILDEPFSGLDPLGRLDLRNLILELKSKGTTIFMSSHILSDVEDICDRVSIMNKGEIKKIFRLDETATMFGETFVLAIEPPSNDIPELGELATGETHGKVSGKIATIYKFEKSDLASRALHLVTSQGIPVLEFKSIRPRLEDIFMTITGDTDRG